ncbi:TPA: BppU family phage baseplate upper protein [Listeria innocua]|nr:BppU family phage baseplate upper protein [Listeria innocua]HBM3635857.1 BppU family phage baseplate upper protein [Listeria innocua]HBM3801111.1 BppU family phage baseplate upper protein [Listeria innocua]HBM4012638.1 BppU family phage baseplate upper protein [Listeria innocua]HBM4163500.1 BppU family phage baseplate upper protein [Listeria innocua]
MTTLRKINATLDLNRKTWNIERIEAIQGDIDSLILAVQIVENGKLKDLTDYKPTFAVVLPGTVKYVIDDLHFSNEKMNEGYFEYTFVKEAFSVPGVYDTARFILQNEDGTELSGMPRFTYYVEKDPLQGKVIAESYISDFERLEQMIHDVETEIAGLHDEVTSESMRLDTEIAELDAKIDTETSKLQTEANDLQTQFDSFNPAQFAQQDEFENHIYDSDIHVTIANKISWEAKETPDGAQAKADKALDDAKFFYELSSSVQSVTLTPKNGFVASQPVVARYIKFGNRFLVIVSGIVGKGTGSGTGICATLPTFLAPDASWNKLYSAAQQSTAASNQANIYLSVSADINIIGVGSVDVNTGLDGIIYLTKEVTT